MKITYTDGTGRAQDVESISFSHYGLATIKLTCGHQKQFLVNWREPGECKCAEELANDEELQKRLAKMRAAKLDDQLAEEEEEHERAAEEDAKATREKNRVGIMDGMANSVLED